MATVPRRTTGGICCPASASVRRRRRIAVPRSRSSASRACTQRGIRRSRYAVSRRSSSMVSLVLRSPAVASATTRGTIAEALARTSAAAATRGVELIQAMNARISAPRPISRQLTPYRVLEPSHRRGGTVRVLEDRRTRDKYGRPRGDDSGSVIRLDPAVDLEFGCEVAAVERGADRFDLIECALDELLSTKSGTDAHHEREVQRIQIRQHGVDGRLRI